jgi:hypothetical protein
MTRFGSHNNNVESLMVSSCSSAEPVGTESQWPIAPFSRLVPIPYSIDLCKGSEVWYRSGEYGADTLMRQ